MQKGDAVRLSLGTEAPILGLAAANQTYPQDGYTGYESGTFTGKVTYAKSREVDGSSNNTVLLVEEDTSHAGFPWIRADLANAIGPTVNELRQAIQVQRILERDARSGTRYTEIVQSHFGVISPDARLQRPEYLGGGSTPVNISPIAHTDTDAGKLAAMGTAAFTGHGFSKSFTEHCIIIGIVNVRADLTYQEGLDRQSNYLTGSSRELRHQWRTPLVAQGH